MPVPYSANLRWRVIWFVYILQNSVAEASFVLIGVCERTVERCISKFPVVRSYGSTSFAPREELIVFAYQICKPQFLSVVQSPFDNCHSPFSPTAFFEISVCQNGNTHVREWAWHAARGEIILFSHLMCRFLTSSFRSSLCKLPIFLYKKRQYMFSFHRGPGCSKSGKRFICSLTLSKL